MAVDGRRARLWLSASVLRAMAGLGSWSAKCCKGAGIAATSLRSETDSQYMRFERIKVIMGVLLPCWVRHVCEGSQSWRAKCPPRPNAKQNNTLPPSKRVNIKQAPQVHERMQWKSPNKQ